MKEYSMQRGQGDTSFVGLKNSREDDGDGKDRVRRRRDVSLREVVGSKSRP